MREATGGHGADVVVEHVGEATWKTSLQVAATGGRIAVCGATSGPNPPANLHRIWWKQLTVVGSTMGTQEDFRAVYELVASGRAKPVVDRVFPLAEAAAAHEHLEAGRQLGKVVLRIGDVTTSRARSGARRRAGSRPPTSRRTSPRSTGAFVSVEASRRAEAEGDELRPAPAPDPRLLRKPRPLRLRPLAHGQSVRRNRPRAPSESRVSEGLTKFRSSSRARPHSRYVAEPS